MLTTGCLIRAHVTHAAATAAGVVVVVAVIVAAAVVLIIVIIVAVMIEWVIVLHDAVMMVMAGRQAGRGKDGQVTFMSPIGDRGIGAIVCEGWERDDDGPDKRQSVRNSGSRAASAICRTHLIPDPHSLFACNLLLLVCLFVCLCNQISTPTS